MELKASATAAAHLLAAECARLGFAAPESPVTGTAVIEEAGIRIVISVTRFLGRPQDIGHTAHNGGSLVNGPTKSMRQILEVLTPTYPAFRKAEWIASKCNKRCNGGFRTMLSKLKKAGLLESDVDGRGYRIKGDGGSTPAPD